ncbi:MULTISPECIES: outer membrane usher protein [unclassified Serratia (in: enterobacteria)]|uniref:outer membrane usher protein n=1 Tax=unclassified Serratia (in: enterobacteria) TaxID=2647522 RepID=UPI002ED3F35D|nr:outer membrane usher protein [Serratia sp. C2(2)]MEE4449986.1 outer membrane usher protein [Serratia sp. C2(1)]
MLRYFPRSAISIFCQASLGASVFLCTLNNSIAAEEVQFNTDILDIKDRENIDLSQFSRKGYILPGTYTLAINLNANVLPERPINFYTAEHDEHETVACLTPELVDQLGLTEKSLSQVTWWREGQCLNLASLKGMEARGDLGKSTLYLSIPQAYLEYSAPNWDPPSRWEDGLPGLLFDYNMNLQSQQQNGSGSGSGTDLSGNGTTGANLGAWRLRADWQARYDRRSGNNHDTGNRSWDWSRYYAYRALGGLGAKLSLGEDYFNSAIFDSFRFTGASLMTDDNMLPPNLRGYAPEVSGVAKGNAKVIISQQGRIIKEVQVAAGPYRIQDLDSAVSGNLDVRVEEQDGSVQQYQVNTATIPYLTRPGQVRYKAALGKPSDWQHHMNGPLFASGEFSWGVSNGWSLYGGGIGGGDYNALSAGVGRDLMMLGALSFDVTHSQAKVPRQETQRGGSYRLSYSKRFDETGSQVTFAGYRFSDSGFRSMSEYLDSLDSGINAGRSKEMYTISLNQQFEAIGLTAYVNYNHQTYWNQADNDRYDLSLARYFDIGRFRNVSLSLTAYRNKYNDTNDDGMYLSLSMPWGGSGTVSYNGSYAAGDSRNSVGYYDRVGDTDSYQVNAGVARSGADLSGYYTHKGTLAQVNTSASYREGQYSALGMSLQGGATLTPEGGALHRSGILGGTRMMIDTDGVAGVPVGGYGSSVASNRFGKAVVTDLTSYYRNSVRINVDKLADNVEASQSVQQGTLTEGAIGYRSFKVISGEKALAVIRLADGSAPPFGATVLNAKQQETGIVNDDGNVYLSGINAGDKMTVHWGNKPQCQITFPDTLAAGMTTNLLLPCVKSRRPE